MIRSPDDPIVQFSEDPIPRRPGTPARLLLFVAALAGYGLALTVAFPPGAPDRLPVLGLSILLALAAAQRWSRGTILFAFLFPLSGLAARLSGGTDPTAWPTLLFAGVAVGWTFRFIYDFDTRPDSSSSDRVLAALLALWALSTLLAVVEARTLWAVAHGLALRTVNGEGLPESTAIRESLLSFGALASGAAFFLMMRRSGDAIRRRTLEAALAGTALSAAVAILQKLSLFPPESHPYWRMTGRLSGGSVDPNTLGLCCGLALAAGAGVWVAGKRRALAGLAIALDVAGLVLSGSRSGLLLAAGSLLLFFLLRRGARTARAAVLAAAAGAVFLLALLLLSASPGSLGGRLVSTFDSSHALATRISARPILWRAAWRLFRENPLHGGGMGAFQWRLPDLLAVERAHSPMRDNPGSAYFQALAETGLIGLLLLLVFAFLLARDAVRRLVRHDGEPVEEASALAVLAFLGVLVVGSHWLAADAGLLFFLVASVAARAPEGAAPFPRRAWLAAAVGLYAVAGTASAISTGRVAETFRYGPRLGLYPAEVGEGGPYQWTRQNFAFWLSPHERFRFALANFSPVGLPVEIVALSEGRAIYRRSLPPGGVVVLRVEGGATRPAELRFALSRSFVPRRLGVPGGDARQLGLRAVFLDTP